jgi:exodeoxyribonuclease V gamma subunit
MLRVEVAQPKAPADWMRVLDATMDIFLQPSRDQADDVRELEAALARLHDHMREGGARAAVPVDVVRAALEALLDDPSRGGVPTGVVTFAAMSSLRNLPYRVICAIGLDDGAFPAASRPLEFDLMAAAPRAGDRQRRDDDRNVFLDLLLAARERLYLSYVGRSVRDNAPLPPSVMIAELLDVLVPALAGASPSAEALAAARARLVVEHPLQAFSIDYFRPGADPRLRSFNAAYRDALRGRLAASAATTAAARGEANRSAARRAADRAAAEGDAGGPPDFEAERASALDNATDPDDADAPDIRVADLPFFASPLPGPAPQWRDVPLDRLIEFVCNPPLYLLRRRLAIRLEEGDPELVDDEPFVQRWTERTAFGERLLPALLAGRSTTEVRSLALAGTEYPPGRFGRMLLERELAQLHRFAADLMTDLLEPTLPPAGDTLVFELDGEPWRLTGTFGDLRAPGLVRHHYSDVYFGDYLSGWIQHLFFNALRVPDAMPRTVWHARDGRYELRPVDDPHTELSRLLALYREGLGVPVHFYPRIAWAYKTRQGERLKRALSDWVGWPDRPGEGAKPWHRLALRGVNAPVDAEFERRASEVLDPLLAHLIDPRLL